MLVLADANIMSIEDKKLISQAQEDEQAYEKLYQKYTRKIYAYFWYRVGHHKETAEDLTQETFLLAFRDIKRFEFRGYSYFSYLLRVAHNLLVNYYRKAKPLPLPEIEKLPAEFTEDVHDIEQRVDSLTIWKAMEEMPINEQNALILFYWDDLPVREISEIMGKSENAVKLLLSRGRKRLAQHPILVNMREKIPTRLREDTVSEEQKEKQATDGLERREV